MRDRVREAEHLLVVSGRLAADDVESTDPSPGTIDEGSTTRTSPARHPPREAPASSATSGERPETTIRQCVLRCLS